MRLRLRDRAPMWAFATGKRVANVVDPKRARQKRTARALDAQVAELIGTRVATGPFAGMVFDRTNWWHLAPYLVGSYEAELASSLEQIIADRPARVLDIGAAEGYYAIGFAMRLPHAVVHAYDPDPWARRLCRRAAVQNAVADRVYTHNYCRPEDFERLAGPETLILMDCEGCENHLLDPVAAPKLRETTIVVELHDFVDPSTSERILARFEGTHDIETITAAVRKIEEWPAIESLEEPVRISALDEGRPSPPPMQWAVMKPRGSGR